MTRRLTKRMKFSKRLDSKKKYIGTKRKVHNRMPIRGGLIVRRSKK